VSKSVLYASIAVTGMLLGFLHYKLKPAVNEQDLRDYAQVETTRTEWQGHIAPDFELKTTDGQEFRLSENVGKKIIVLPSCPHGLKGELPRGLIPKKTFRRLRCRAQIRAHA
jgi:cytochrome oxidase Cu insertion factor (SCO1/SenC/PrrC family)